MRALRSVRGRITLVSTALVATTLLIASVLLMRWVQADLLASAEETLQTSLEDQAQALGADPELFGLDGRLDLVGAEVDGQEIEVGLFTGIGDGLAFGDLYVDGEYAAGLIMEVGTGEVVDVVDPELGERIDDPELIEQVGDLVFEVLELADVQPDADPDNPRFIVGATPLAEIEESVAAVRDALFVLVPALAAIFGALTWLLVGRALRPVMSITEQVEAISASSLHQRVPVPDSGDEVAELATVMNRMLDRLERGGQRQRQFSADASHELRSPLSTVRAAAELLTGSPPPQRAGRLAGDIVAEADRMDQLITDLLELSRLDEDRGPRSSAESTDLAALVLAELAAELDGPTGPVAVAVSAPDAVPVVGDPRQLRRLVRNLADNALRHAAGRVEVAVAATGAGGARLVVDDDGHGVPPADRATVFERFSRLDEARSRDAGGSGLGLALVRAIAEGHGGTVTVDDSPLGGARFTVQLGRP